MLDAKQISRDLGTERYGTVQNVTGYADVGDHVMIMRGEYAHMEGTVEQVQGNTAAIKLEDGTGVQVLLGWLSVQ